MARAYGHLSSVLGGPQGLLQYLMLERNTFEQLALANAKAINGLQPKITVWNTGDQSGGDAAMAGAGGISAVRNIMQSLPPLFSTINDQTGIQPPGWLASMGPQPQSQAVMEAPSGYGGKMNGFRGKDAGNS